MTNLIIAFGIGVIVGAALGATIVGFSIINKFESRIKQKKEENNE